MYSIILKDKGVVSILICSKANIMIEISGFILNNETYLQFFVADKSLLFLFYKKIKMFV